MKETNDLKEYLSISEIKKWIVEEKSNDYDLGRLLREYFWKNVDKKDL